VPVNVITDDPLDCELVVTGTVELTALLPKEILLSEKEHFAPFGRPEQERDTLLP
jgi:hypothetical protein